MTAQREAVSRAPANGVPKVQRTLRVLLADDDRDMCLTLMMLLREEGHDTRSVHSGREVLAAVRDFRPDAIILDIHMPELSGWEVARTIRSQHGLQPLIIGVSGEYKQGADRILSEIVGFNHYVLKPCDPAVLLMLLAPLRESSGEPPK